MRKIIVVVSLFLFFCSHLVVKSQLRYNSDPASFLLPEEPSVTSRILASGLISTGLDEVNGSFSLDFHEFYFTVFHRNDISAILVTRYSGGVWRYPEVVHFSGIYQDADPHVSPCGKRIYFSSTRPLEVGGRDDVWNLWYVDRLDDEWSKPVPIVLDSNRHERHPTISNSGTLYFQADYGTSLVTFDFLATNIYYAIPNVSGWDAPMKLQAPVNSDHADYSPFISPDDSFIIFASNRPGGYGNSDLYIANRNEDGIWGNVRNLGSSVNSSENDHYPSLSPDGRFIFFASNRKLEQPIPAGRINYTYFKRVALGAGNGLNDIYFAGTSVLNL